VLEVRVALESIVGVVDKDLVELQRHALVVRLHGEVLVEGVLDALRNVLFIDRQ
jgi:hypothetical protein